MNSYEVTKNLFKNVFLGNADFDTACLVCHVSNIISNHNNLLGRASATSMDKAKLELSTLLRYL